MIRKSPESFGVRLAHLRAAKGLGLRELARLAGISPTAVVKIEAGSVPGWETVRKLALALGVSITEFL